MSTGTAQAALRAGEAGPATLPVSGTPRTPPPTTVPDVQRWQEMCAGARSWNLLREERLREERKRNIVVKGLREDLPDGDEGAVNRMLHAMDLGYLKSKDCGAKRVGKATNSRPRLLIVTFQHERYAQQILMDKIKLLWTKDNNYYGNFSDVFIDPDMTREERQAEFANRRDSRMMKERERNEEGRLRLQSKYTEDTC